MKKSPILKEVRVNQKDLLPFVLKLFKDYKGQLTVKADPEDLLAEAMLGLSQSLSRFKTKRKASIVTYAYLRVRGQMIRSLVRENKFFNSHEAVEKLRATYTTDLEETLAKQQLIDKVMERIEVHMDPVVGAVVVWSFIEDCADADILKRLKQIDRRYKLQDVAALRKQGLQELRQHFTGITRVRS